MDQPVKIVQYLNQFFAGIGAEDKADTPPEYRAGPIGPGVALANLVGEQGAIVGTLVCGDNYFIEHQESALTQLLEMAEASGLSPGYSCRTGICGTCATQIKCGSVDYMDEPIGPREENEVLICCSTPRSESGDQTCGEDCGVILDL